jgi:ABC-type sugar transport system ATPase subunit
VLDELRGRLALKAPDADAQVQTLSGGNQQKVVLGRWLAGRPGVLLLDEPTRGIDVGAKAQIYEIVQALTEDGTAVLLVSSELEELLAMADRVLVLREGRQRGWFPRGTPRRRSPPPWPAAADRGLAADQSPGPTTSARIDCTARSV